MSEEVTSGLEEIKETSEQEQQVNEPVEQETQKTPEQINLAAMRKIKEQAQLEEKKAKEERDELARKLKEYEEKLNNKQEPQDSSSLDVDEDDFVEGRHLSAVAKELKKIKEDLMIQQQQNQVALVENRLKNTYNDFDSVVSKENLELLTAAYPEIAKTIYSSSDLYNKGVTAYTLIKQFQINAKNDININKNIQKPMVGASNNKNTPLDKANEYDGRLSSEDKDFHWKQLQKVLNS